jgi:hypothetical protein
VLQWSNYGLVVYESEIDEEALKILEAQTASNFPSEAVADL